MVSSVPELIEARTVERIAQAAGVEPVNVRMWKQRRSIPSKHWRALADEGIASLDELADLAAGHAA